MRWIIGAVVAFSVCVTVYIGSAVVSLASLVAAVRDGDATRVMERTDYVRVRHSLVDQLVDTYLAKLGQRRPVKPFERMAIATFGSSIADDLVNKLITPENVSVLLRTGKVRGTVETTEIGNIAALADLDVRHAYDIMRRTNVIKPVEFGLQLGTGGDSGSISMHFQDWGWKLSGINLPPAILQRLVDQLPIK